MIPVQLNMDALAHPGDAHQDKQPVMEIPRG